MTITNNIIGANIRRLRGKRIAWKLAAVAGIPSGTWSRIECGEQLPHVSTLGKIAKALGCPVGDLLAGWTGNGNGPQPSQSASTDSAQR